MTANAFNNQRPNQLENQARKVAIDHFVVLRHWMEEEMACLISNPQLNAN